MTSKGALFAVLSSIFRYCQHLQDEIIQTFNYFGTHRYTSVETSADSGLRMNGRTRRSHFLIIEPSMLSWLAYVQRAVALQIIDTHACITVAASSCKRIDWFISLTSGWCNFGLNKFSPCERILSQEEQKPK